jgi:Fe-S oxidoreductase/nitrate reductase gamma subunit
MDVDKMNELIARESMLFVGTGAKFLMYLAAALAMAILFYGLHRKLKLYGLNWKSFWQEVIALAKSRPGQRFGDVWRYALMQRKMLRVPYAGIFHWLIYVGMFVLFLGTVLVFTDEKMLRFFGLRLLQGSVYLTFEVVLDTFGLLFVIGLVLALMRRLLWRPGYLPNNSASVLVLLLLLYIGASGFLLQGLRLFLRPVDWASYSYAGYIIAGWISFAQWEQTSATSFYQILWWSHAVAAFSLIALLPFSKMYHMMAIPVNILVSGEQKPKAKLSTPFNIFEVSESSNEEPEIKVGLGKISDLDWKRRLALDACVNCGRCERSCPANSSGRRLSPRDLIQKLRFELEVGVRENEDFFDRGVLEEDTVWSCTNCAACMEECPAQVNHVEYVLDLRRQLVTSGKMDEKKIDLLTNVDRNNNPYGLPSYQRAEWLLEMGVNTVEDCPEAEYVYWIGCAGSYDDRARKIVLSIIRILQHAGISFAILGTREKCCGEPTKRLGEEGRFQLLAMENVETLQQYVGDKKIVTHCPHCYNTLKFEYRDFGGQFEVVHHTELLQTLFREGRLKVERGLRKRVAYHDPCNLGRLNNIYDPPREVLVSILQGDLAEPLRTRDAGFCCGAGGDNAWYSVPEREKISSVRLKEVASQTGAEVLAIACPYCASMFEDAVKTEGLEGKTVVRDVAEILAEHISSTSGEAFTVNRGTEARIAPPG